MRSMAVFWTLLVLHVAFASEIDLKGEMNSSEYLSCEHLLVGNHSFADMDLLSALSEYNLPVTAIREFLDDFGGDVNDQDHKGRTALHCAVYRDFPELIRPLIERKADINIVDKFGETPVQMAYTYGLRNSTKIFEDMFLRAARMGDGDIFRKMIKSGIDLNATENAETALMLAAMYGNRENVKALLETYTKQNKSMDKIDEIRTALRRATNGVADLLREHIANIQIDSPVNATNETECSSTGYSFGTVYLERRKKDFRKSCSGVEKMCLDEFMEKVETRLRSDSYICGMSLNSDFNEFMRHTKISFEDVLNNVKLKQCTKEDWEIIRVETQEIFVDPDESDPDKNKDKSSGGADAGGTDTGGTDTDGPGTGGADADGADTDRKTTKVSGGPPASRSMHYGGTKEAQPDKLSRSHSAGPPKELGKDSSEVPDLEIPENTERDSSEVPDPEIPENTERDSSEDPDEPGFYWSLIALSIGVPFCVVMAAWIYSLTTPVAPGLLPAISGSSTPPAPNTGRRVIDVDQKPEPQPELGPEPEDRVNRRILEPWSPKLPDHIDSGGIFDGSFSGKHGSHFEAESVAKTGSQQAVLGATIVPTVPVAAVGKATREREDNSAHFQVFAPGQVHPDTNFLINVYAYAKEFEEEMKLEAYLHGDKMLGAKRGISLVKDTRVAIKLVLPEEFKAVNDEDDFTWNGTICNAQFDVDTMPYASPGLKICKALIVVGGIQVAILRFRIEMVDDPKPNKPYMFSPIDVDVKVLENVFVCYALQDEVYFHEWRDMVTSLQNVKIEGMMELNKHRDTQTWHHTIRNPERWKKYDMFVLFWTDHARLCADVEKEWTNALKYGNKDFFHIVRLREDPPIPTALQETGQVFFDSFVSGRTGVKFERPVTTPPRTAFNNTQPHKPPISEYNWLTNPRPQPSQHESPPQSQHQSPLYDFPSHETAHGRPLANHSEATRPVMMSEYNWLTNPSPLPQSNQRESTLQPRQRETPPHSPPHESPRHEPPRYEFPRHESPRHESPRHEPPRHESPRHESPRRESPRRESLRHESPQSRHDTSRQSGQTSDPRPHIPPYPIIDDKRKEEACYVAPKYHYDINVSPPRPQSQKQNLTNSSSVGKYNWLTNPNPGSQPSQSHEDSPRHVSPNGSKALIGSVELANLRNEFENGRTPSSECSQITNPKLASPEVDREAPMIPMKPVKPKKSPNVTSPQGMTLEQIVDQLRISKGLQPIYEEITRRQQIQQARARPGTTNAPSSTSPDGTGVKNALTGNQPPSATVEPKNMSSSNHNWLTDPPQHKSESISRPACDNQREEVAGSDPSNSRIHAHQPKNARIVKQFPFPAVEPCPIGRLPSVGQRPHIDISVYDPPRYTFDFNAPPPSIHGEVSHPRQDMSWTDPTALQSEQISRPASDNQHVEVTGSDSPNSRIHARPSRQNANTIDGRISHIPEPHPESDVHPSGGEGQLPSSGQEASGSVVRQREDGTSNSQQCHSDGSTPLPIICDVPPSSSRSGQNASSSNWLTNPTSYQAKQRPHPASANELGLSTGHGSPFPRIPAYHSSRDDSKSEEKPAPSDGYNYNWLTNPKSAFSGDSHTHSDQSSATSDTDINLRTDPRNETNPPPPSDEYNWLTNPKSAFSEDEYKHPEQSSTTKPGKSEKEHRKHIEQCLQLSKALGVPRLASMGPEITAASIHSGVSRAANNSSALGSRTVDEDGYSKFTLDHVCDPVYGTLAARYDAEGRSADSEVLKSSGNGDTSSSEADRPVTQTPSTNTDVPSRLPTPSDAAANAAEASSLSDGVRDCDDEKEAGPSAPAQPLRAGLQLSTRPFDFSRLSSNRSEFLEK